MFAIVVFAVAFLALWMADAPPRPDGRPGRGALTWLVWFVPLLVFAGNRYNGADWINYKQTFTTLAASGGPVAAVVDSPLEWLFSLLLWAIGAVGLPYEAVVLVVGVFNTFALLHVLKRIGAVRLGRTFALLFLIEGWTLYHEQLRQSLAVTLCLLALVQYVSNRRVGAVLLWIAAIGCHSSAIVTPLLLVLARSVRRSGGKPIPLRSAIVFSVLTFVIVSGLFTAVREGLLPIPGIERLQNKLQLYEEHDVFGGTLFTAGLIGYVLGLVLLLPLRGVVERRGEFWLSFSWSAAVLWSLLGPLLRTQAILIRFEHYLLIFLPLAIGLLLGHKELAGFKRAAVTLFACVFASTFPLRVFLNPENVVWSLNYQNFIVYGALGLELEDDGTREQLICANLALFDNDFCGRGTDAF